MKLEHRHILITGASSGIGLASARLFAAEGARLALVARGETRLQQALGQLADPERHVALAGDMTVPGDVERVVNAAHAALGRVDGLVLSAGRDRVAPFDETTLADWNGILAANMTSAFLVCQAALPHLRAAGGGTIVTLASGLGLLPLPGRAAYSAAKAGLIMFSKALALDLAPDHIRVNALCPGAIDTPMLRESAGGEMGDPMPQAIVSRFALGRVGEADEVARAALFLSSDDASFVTGTALAADGGRSFH